MSEFHANVKHYYQQIYFESIDIVVNCIRSRFEQKDYVNCYAKVESTFLLAVKGEPFGEHILAIYSFYGDDLEQHNQLKSLERFLIALIRIALTYHLSLIDCVS